MSNQLVESLFVALGFQVDDNQLKKLDKKIEEESGQNNNID